MKIAFLGTPEFAVPSLEMLYNEGHELALFTQPDRPVGRKATLTAPPAKVFALDHNIPVFQFEKIRLPEGVSALKAFAPDLMVTAAFGQLLSAENLSIPRLGTINVHGSLLPKYRGAAPIQWAVINGEHETGITTMMTDIGMDTGDILLSETVTIGEDETAGELYERLAGIGANVLKRTLDCLEAGTLIRIKQDETAATKCSMLKKEHGHVDFSMDAHTVHNLVRGVNPWPGAYASMGDDVIKIWKTRLTDRTCESIPGTCFGSAKEGLFITCGNGAVEVLELQATGGKRLDGKTFLRGRDIIGKQFT